MAEISTLFWDVGGVLLTNGWDKNSRRQAAEKFHLDWEHFEERHGMLVADFETGRLALEEYLERTVFYRARGFGREEFKEFMLSQSQPRQESFELLKEVARSGEYLMGTLNNESLELNLYRIERFSLCRYFTLFFSSCFLGMRKPEETIYRAALQITQRAPEECLFIDDRAPNLERAQCLGMRTIQFQQAAQVRRDLARLGVLAGESRE